MDAELRILSGSRAGAVVRLAGNALTIGRHPESDVRFSPEHDVAISARHAVLLRGAAGWVLRDLGSRNGSYVNGTPISADTPLQPGDRLGFGTPDTTALFCVAERGASALVAATRVAAPVRVPARTRAARLALMVAVAVGVGGVVVVIHEVRQRTAWRDERAHLQARIDSIRRTEEQATRALEGEVSGLAEALDASQTEIRSIRAELVRAREQPAPAELGHIERRLKSASTALGEQQRAAALDFGAIARKNRAAVALVYVEGDDGEVRTGTAFAVRADATLLTNRHVVAGADGAQTPRRIAVQFSHSSQKWPARLLAVAGDADLALIKVDNIAGEVPVVQPFNLRADTLPAGAPVALIGFPLGGEGEGEQVDGLARPLVSAATVASVGARQLELRGYGASGASGSPIFDAEGRLIAILYAGHVAATGQALFAVPAAAATRLMETVLPAPVSSR